MTKERVLSHDEQQARDAFERWLTDTSDSMAISDLEPIRGLSASGDVTEDDRRAAVRHRAAHLRKLLRAALIDWNELPIGEDVVLGCWSELGFCDLRRARDPEREFPALLPTSDKIWK